MTNRVKNIDQTDYGERSGKLGTIVITPQAIEFLDLTRASSPSEQ